MISCVWKSNNNCVKIYYVYLIEMTFYIFSSGWKLFLADIQNFMSIKLISLFLKLSDKLIKVLQ